MFGARKDGRERGRKTGSFGGFKVVLGGKGHVNEDVTAAERVFTGRKKINANLSRICRQT